MSLLDKEFFDFLKFLIIAFIVIFIFSIFASLGTQSFRIYFNPKVEVFVDKNLIYKGSDCCVYIKSSGFSTTVKTSKFFCIFPDKSYTSKDVVVKTVE